MRPGQEKGSLLLRQLGVGSQHVGQARQARHRADQTSRLDTRRLVVRMVLVMLVMLMVLMVLMVLASPRALSH